MAADDMAADFITEVHGAFEVDARSLCPAAERRSFAGFGRGLHRKAAALGTPFGCLDDCEANTGTRDRGAGRERLCGIVARDLEMQVSLHLCIDDFPDR